MDNVKAIFFDFDNTLGNRYEYSRECFRHLIMEYLPEIEPDSLLFASMLHDFTVFDQYGDAGHNRSILDRIEKRYNVKIAIDDYYDWWRKNQYKYVCLFEDAVDTLNELKKKYKIGIITNGHSTTQWNKICGSGIQDMFDLIVVSGDINIHKPDPRIYQYSCDMLGLKPEECVYVGDNFFRDIYGAQKAGLKTVWIWVPQQDYSDYPVTRIHKLSELLEIFPVES